MFTVVALDCKQHFWPGILPQWCGAVAPELCHHRRDTAGWPVHLWYILGTYSRRYIFQAGNSFDDETPILIWIRFQNSCFVPTTKDKYMYYWRLAIRLCEIEWQVKANLLCWRANTQVSYCIILCTLFHYPHQCTVLIHHHIFHHIKNLHKSWHCTDWCIDVDCKLLKMSWTWAWRPNQALHILNVLHTGHQVVSSRL